MKRITFNMALLMSFSIQYGTAQAISNTNGFIGTISFLVTHMPKDDLEPEDPVKGNRDNPERLPALVSERGVAIERVSESEIISYDIYTTSGIQVGSFGSGEDFSSTLFSLEGEYELRFTTSEYIYVGYVWMENK